jgi:hypothetical protein
MSSDDTEITLMLERKSLDDFPEKLEVLAARQEKAADTAAIRKCADVFRGWMKTNAKTIACTRSEKSWWWIIPRASAAGANNLAAIIQASLLDALAKREAAATQKEFDTRTAAAMAEYREGNPE